MATHEFKIRLSGEDMRNLDCVCNHKRVPRAIWCRNLIMSATMHALSQIQDQTAAEKLQVQQTAGPSQAPLLPSVEALKGMTELERNMHGVFWERDEAGGFIIT